MSRDTAWDFLAQESLRPDNGNVPCVEQIRAAVEVLAAENLLSLFYDWYVEKYRIFLSRDAIPAFWDNFSPEDTAEEYGSRATLRLANAVDQLLEECRKWDQNPVIGSVLSELPDCIEKEQHLVSILKSSLVAHVPHFFHRLVLIVYSYCFRISRHVKLRKNSSGHGETSCDESFLLEEGLQHENASGCAVCGKSLASESLDLEMADDFESDLNREMTDQSTHSSCSDDNTCSCSEILEAFEKMNAHALEVNGLLDEVIKDAVTSVVLNYIDKYVRLESRASFNTHSIDRQLRWVRSVVSDWLFLVYKESDGPHHKKLNDWLVYLAHEIFAGIRIEQLFDIIIEYPDSVPALMDLKGCLEQCFNFRAVVVETLTKSFEERLLHPGVATNDILTAYIQTIKALRMLDPTGVLLQLVCDPLKSYLKGKEDTVRCIITNLTDVNSELIPELVRGGSKDDAAGSQSDDENIIRSWKDWKPDPIDAGKAPKNTRSVRSSDIVSILVDVYESKDLFVEEYQSLLSQRFLTSFECNIEFERRNLELLTLKFGEADLHACEVMLQDMTSSKRIDVRINSGEIANYHFTDFSINCIIVSAQFWPEKFRLNHYDEGSSLIVPSVVEKAISSYTKAFETIKGSRTLHWKKNLGIVELELEFGERVISLNVSPLQAVLISMFETPTCWKLNCLSSAIGVSASLLRRKLIFWQNKGIIREVSPDEYCLIEDQSGNNNVTSNVTMLDAEEDLTEESFLSESGKKDRPEDDKFRIYYSYIENMLTNLSDMTLEKIHTTLQMFALQGPSSADLSLPELRQFLDIKVREGLLTYSAGYYKLSPH